MHTASPLFALALFVLLIALLGRMAQMLRGKDDEPTYAPKPILTNNELEFYKRLTAALPEYLVLAQVAMAELMRPRPAAREVSARAYNRISQKRVDYVVVEREALRVLALVELDDRTHQADKDARRDAWTASAGYVTHRFPSRSKPSVTQLRETILSAPPADALAFSNSAGARR